MSLLSITRLKCTNLFSNLVKMLNKHLTTSVLPWEACGVFICILSEVG